MTEHQALLFCTFCGWPRTDAGVLITAPDGSTAICGDCAELAVAIAASHEKDLVAARAKGETEWREREADPDWQKGLHNFVDQTPMPGSRESLSMKCSHERKTANTGAPAALRLHPSQETDVRRESTVEWSVRSGVSVR